MIGTRRTILLLSSILGIATLAIFCRPQNAVRADNVAPPRPDSQTEFTNTVVPLLQQNCYECHANGKHKGDVALDSFKTIDDVEKHRDQWEQVLKDIQDGDMPVAEAKHKPTAAERETISIWIERELYDYDRPIPIPAVSPFTASIAHEYNNTIHDLLAIDFRPADAFSIDDAGYGFDNNGDVLSVAPVLMEKYLDAASQSLDKAIYVEPIVPAPFNIGTRSRWTAPFRCRTRK